MKRQHLYVILALLALGLLVYAPSLIRLPEREPEDGELFEVRVGPPERARAIRIADPTTDTLSGPDSIVLRRDAGVWRVNGRPADTAEVTQLLTALDTLRSGQLVARNPENHARLGVTEAAARRVEIRTGADSAEVFLLGDRSRSGGYYVRRPGADEVYLIEGPAGGLLRQTLEQWRQREVVQVDTAQVMEILIRREEEEYTLARREGGWWVGSASADSAAVRALLETLATLRATGFPTDSAEEAADFENPAGLLNAFTEGEGGVIDRNLAASLRLVPGPEEGDPWLVRRADEAHAMEIPASTARRLLPPKNELTGG